MANQFMGNVGEAKKASNLIMEQIGETSRIEVDPLDPQINPESKASQMPELTGKIVFKNVYFKYKGNQNYTLKNINM